jgi:hypothetical protein
MTQVEFTPSPRILRGLDQIAGYLQISRRTACRWIESQALPAMRSPAGTYMTSTALVDLWIITVWENQRKLAAVDKTYKTDIPPLPGP